MKASTIFGIITLQVAACDVYYFDKAPELPDLAASVKELDFEKSIINNAINCGYSKGNDSLYVDIDSLSKKFNCTSSFKIELKDKNNALSFPSNTEFIFNISYLAYDYISPSKEEFYNNIRFRAIVDDFEFYFVNSLPGTNTTGNPQQGNISIKMPDLKGKKYAGIRIEIENNYIGVNSSNPLPNYIIDNPPGLTINSIYQVISK